MKFGLENVESTVKSNINVKSEELEVDPPRENVKCYARKPSF